MAVKFRTSSRHHEDLLNIPAKANRILNFILIGMFMIVIRIWHLSVVQYDEKVEEARKPQQKTVFEAAKRSTIRDRFGIPLAINKVQYRISLIYSQIRQVPTFSWDKDSEGKTIKRPKRREYITALAQLLAKELDMDPERIEDIIYAKGPMYNQLPVILKEDISEKEYYRLKMLEKDWVGIQVQRIPKRYYPVNKVGADIIGFMGAINRQEYEAVISEMKMLENLLNNHDLGEVIVLPNEFASIDQVRQRHKDLQEQAYTINDSIGKAGIEGHFESALRGYRGKKSYFSNAKGIFLREIPGSKEPLSGKRIVLTISSELQKFAEELLIKNESIRQTRLSHLNEIKHTILAFKQPWIKGGAIIAIDPNNGELLAMASHPRFDPNDFIASGDDKERKEKRCRVQKWLESETYLAEIWDQQRFLEREIFDRKTSQIISEEKLLTWENYLDLILDKDSPLRKSSLFSGTILDAIKAQKNADALTLTQGNTPESYDNLLFIDLMRIAVQPDLFSDELLAVIGTQNLSQYKNTSVAMVKIKEVVRMMSKDIFHEIDFKQWRTLNEKIFLKEKRANEKINHTYAKPYIDYLDTQENDLFQAFWQKHQWDLISAFLQGKTSSLDLPEPYLNSICNWYTEISKGAHQNIDWIDSYHCLKDSISTIPYPLVTSYLQTFRSYKQLTRPLIGSYRHLRKSQNKKSIEKDLAAAFYPKQGYGYARSQAYRQATTQGSLFKLVTAYEALSQRYKKLTLSGEIPTNANLNPLEMIDLVFHKGKDLYVGYDCFGQAIPRHYKGGRLPRSISSSIGKLDLLKALETSSNPYFALIAGDVLDSPNDLLDAAKQFSFGSRTGLSLPGEIAGKVPNDLESNRTGLYSFAIGQHTLVVTPLQTALMLSAIANGGKILKPKIVNMFMEKVPTEVKRQMFFPEPIQKMLLDAMCRVVSRSHGESLSNLSRLYSNHPEAIQDYISLKYQLVGKTSTSESVENIDLDLIKGTNIYTHVWFGGIVYEQDVFDKDQHRFHFKNASGKTELVVVVYLRYGGYGKEAAPLAAQVAQKWREIKYAREQAL